MNLMYKNKASKIESEKLISGDIVLNFYIGRLTTDIDHTALTCAVKKLGLCYYGEGSIYGFVEFMVKQVYHKNKYYPTKSISLPLLVKKFIKFASDKNQKRNSYFLYA